MAKFLSEAGDALIPPTRPMATTPGRTGNTFNQALIGIPLAAALMRHAFLDDFLPDAR